MSLFRGQDKHLPLLTQIVQIDFSDRAEVEAFYREGMNPNYMPIPELEAEVAKEIEEFAKLGRTAQAILNQIVDGNGPTVKQMQVMQTFQQKFQPVLLWEKDFYSDRCYLTPDELIHKIPGAFDHQNAGLLENLTRRTVDHLLYFKDRLKKLRRCEECGNPFVIQSRHPDQSNCSHRCAARIARRRYRNKEKVLEKTLN